MINQQIQNYKIISLLGEGGMANVYLAVHTTLKGKVAIKLLKDEFVANKNIRKRFLAEARILHQLAHVNIIKVTDLIDAGDIVAFVMEYVEGESLSEFIIKKGKLSDTDIEYIFPQMLSAVSYIHEKGLIHRDVKPSNFMMTKEGSIKLLDFGIAKNTNEGQNEYTQTGTSDQMGTPLYMSPEQVQSTKEVTSQSDIYSLGVVLWQMVMNKKPYNAENLSLVEIQIQIFQEPLALTKTIWDPFIQKATKKKLEDRYSNAKLFLKSFNDFLLEKKKKNELDDTVFDTNQEHKKQKSTIFSKFSSKVFSIFSKQNKENTSGEEYSENIIKSSIIFKNETVYDIYIAITFYDSEKDDFLSIGHYEIEANDFLEYFFPEDFIQDYLWLRGYYIDEKGEALVYEGEDLGYNNYYYNDVDEFEVFNEIIKEDFKANYLEIELADEITEFTFLQ